MRIDKTIKPVSPFGRQQIMYSRQKIYLLYWLLKKLLLYPGGGLGFDGWEWALLCIKPPSNASAGTSALRRLVLNRAVKRGCLVSSALFSWIYCFMCALSSSQVPVFLKSPRMKTNHSLLDLVLVFRVFSSLLLASSWRHGKWGHTRCVDWDQPNSDMAWMAKCDIGQLPIG